MTYEQKQTELFFQVLTFPGLCVWRPLLGARRNYQARQRSAFFYFHTLAIMYFHKKIVSILLIPQVC